MAHDSKSAVRGACECGSCSFEMAEAPTVRLICHCTLCQAFTGKGFSDVMVVPKAKVKMSGEANISFRKYKTFRFPPPNLARGRCKTCDKPVVEVGGVWPMQLLFLPAANFVNPKALAAPEAHMFYEHRLHDVDDGVPKHEGYFPSQVALVKMIMHAM